MIPIQNRQIEYERNFMVKLFMGIIIGIPFVFTSIMPKQPDAEFGFRAQKTNLASGRIREWEGLIGSKVLRFSFQCSQLHGSREPGIVRL